LTLLLWSLACGDDHGPAVPFKLGDPAATSPETDPSVVDTNGTDDSTNPAPADLAVSTTLRAAVEPTGTLVLRQANAAATDAPVLSLLSPEAGCRVTGSRVSGLSAVHAWASADVECFSSAQVSDKEPQAATTTHHEHWIVDAGSSPRVLEHLRVLPALDAATPQDISVTFRGEDIDSDGNPDLVGTFQLAADAEATHTIELRWLNRASGLDRDASALEAGLTKLAKHAKTAQATDTTGQAALQTALTFYDALCAESGHARLWVGRQAGVRCAPSAGAGLAWSLKAKADAENANVFAAVASFERLNDPALRVTDVDRSAVRAALERRASRTPWTWVQGPMIASVAAPALRLPQLAFVDDHTLMLRGAALQTFDVTTGTVSDAGTEASDLLVTDPTKRYAIVAIEKHCDGVHLKIVRASQVVSGQVLGPAISEPLIDPAVTAARCASGNSASRVPDDSGRVVLGWGPKGILVARGNDRQFVPVDDNAQPAGSLTPMGSSLPLPTALAFSGMVASDGSACVTATSLGLIVQTSANPAGQLVMPQGPVSAQDIAVAPGGTRIAYVFGGRVFVGTPASTTP